MTEGGSREQDFTVKLPILIVDDDHITCKLMAKLLAVLGYETDIALDGPSALKLFGQKKYGLAISDYQMPTRNAAVRVQTTAVAISASARFGISANSRCA